MSDVVFAEEGYCGILDALTEDLVLWVRLYTNDPPLTRDSVRDDFVEAVYDVYEPFAIPRWTKAALRGGKAIAVPDLPQFIASGPDFGLPIRGYFVTHGRTGPLAWAWRRPGDPFQFSVENSVLTVFIRLEFPFNAGG